MYSVNKKQWAAVVLSAGLLELPFPLAGPMQPWRGVFAWFALVPLIVAILWPAMEWTSAAAQTTDLPRSGVSRSGRISSGLVPSGFLKRGFLLGYLCGVLWYAGNCYWIYDTMHIYGGLPSVVSVLLLLAFSLYLGLYFGVFGFVLALVRQATGDTKLALLAVPFLWTAVELAAARVTSFPWDQLGASQVDNTLLCLLAPRTGIYGISFVLAAANALLAAAFLLKHRSSQRPCALAGVLMMVAGTAGLFVSPPRPEVSATAVLMQPNLDVGGANNWDGAQWDQHMAEFARLAGEQCKSYIAGIPQTGAPTAQGPCPAVKTNPSVKTSPAGETSPPVKISPDLIAWPESPAPYFEPDPRFSKSMASLAKAENAPLIIGGIGGDYSEQDQAYRDYNSAMIFSSQGERVGRYDKIHLVPFGEYVPFQNLLRFARSLTKRISALDAGVERKVFRLNGHRYGVFICYESVFADEVRQFAQLGGEVFVNVSDDGWYGDTSAPWQHLNMARMRAIENRRWILRDTNSGVTASIDPYGTVRQSIPRHQMDALLASYGFVQEVTFYTAHGDLFAYGCALLSIGLVGWSARKSLRGHLSLPKITN